MDLRFSHKRPADTRVVVAMSGGVDSSATAGLLVEAGYEVIGVTLQLYDHGKAVARAGTCCAGRDIHDARRVAETLGIPHYVLDYEARFRRDVIDDFAETYLRGETPIPCVRCNETVKFRDLLETSLDLGADLLVTGHYVRWREGASGPEMWRGADHSRDQSYFLFATTAGQLARLRFPLGDMTKDETRAAARRFGLAVAEKQDSQDICFVPEGRYTDLLEKLRPGAVQPGEIVDQSGRVLGHHRGIVHYTVGQRRGLDLPGGHDPLYVLRLEAEANRVVVGPRAALEQGEVAVHGFNWLAEPLDRQGRAVVVKLRSTQDPVAAKVFAGAEQGWARVVLDAPVAGVAPGQACVIYDGERMLGGGWIGRSDG